VLINRLIILIIISDHIDLYFHSLDYYILGISAKNPFLIVLFSFSIMIFNFVNHYYPFSNHRNHDFSIQIDSTNHHIIISAI
jgi:hypothetical protein